MSLGVFNPYMATLGGGERSTLAFASALQQTYDLPVTIYAVDPAPSIAELREAFGFPLKDFSLETATDPDESFEMACHGGHSHFVNHCYGAGLPNPAPFGIYAMMFPTPGDATLLHTYDWIVCNSEFTAHYTSKYLPEVSGKVRVVYPPTREIKHPEVPKNWRAAAHVGRFGSVGHDKRQRDLARIITSINTKLEGEKFSLTCCGRVTERAYFDRCQREATPQTRFLEDPTEQEVESILAGSGIYIHATGLDLPRGDQPELCEHFGISVAEAMAHGCIPLAYARGGPVEMIRHGVNGFLFESSDELREQLHLLSRLPTSVLTQMSGAARKSGRRYNVDSFSRQLAIVAADLTNPVKELPRPARTKLD